MLISQYLVLDVTWPYDVLLNKDSPVTKRANSLFSRQNETFLSFSIVPGNSHSFSTTTGTSLDHDRIANLVCDAQHIGDCLNLVE